MSMTASMIILVSAVGSTWGEVPVTSMPQSEVHTVANSQSCPVNLLAQRQEIERLIKSVSNASFKTTILASLNASIPDAIRQGRWHQSSDCFFAKRNSGTRPISQGC